MPRLELTPIVGMNIRQEDDALQIADRQYGRRLKVRDAINVNIEPTGELVMRKSGRKITDLPYTNLWQSPLHKDVFAELAGALVIIDMNDMSHKTIGVTGGNNSYCVINSMVVIAGANGLFKYNGKRLIPLTVDTPAKPIVDVGTDGNMQSGTYGVALSWVGEVEGSASEIEFREIATGDNMFHLNKSGSLHITLPFCYQENVERVRIYLTNTNGTELLLHSEHPIREHKVDIYNVDNLTSPPTFVAKEPMPRGKYLKYWNGRIITAEKNLIKFSEAMSYHIHSPVYGYIEMPQRVTFIEPLDDGIWVGQTTGVVFLQGRDLESTQFNYTGAHTPIPNSAVRVKSEVVRNINQTNEDVILWLADNGYVLGNNQGQVIELQSNDMIGLTAGDAHTVVNEDRITTLIL